MTRSTIVLATLCAWASGCGEMGEGEPTASRRAPQATGGEAVGYERSGFMPELARTDPEQAADISGAGTTGIGMVHDADDASYATPLPLTDDPLDLRRSVPPTGDVAIPLCPAGLRGLSARSVVLSQGAALELRAEADAVDDLRARMQRFAAALGAKPTGEMGALGASQVRVVMIPGGARLEAMTGDAAMVNELRRQLREDAEILSRGLCPVSLQIVA